MTRSGWRGEDTRQQGGGRGGFDRGTGGVGVVVLQCERRLVAAAHGEQQCNPLLSRKQPLSLIVGNTMF